MTPPAARYACHDKPREAKPLLVQDGWHFDINYAGEPTRLPRMVGIPHAMSTDCRYDRAHADSRCAGCRSKATESQ